MCVYIGYTVSLEWTKCRGLSFEKGRSCVNIATLTTHDTLSFVQFADIDRVFSVFEEDDPGRGGEGSMFK